MILAIGIDAIEIVRFAHWANYQKKSLLKVFSKDEIAYCLENHLLSAQRFAVRFAAKEAFFKALCAAFCNERFNSITVFKSVEIIKKANGHPELLINWPLIWQNNQKPSYCLSLQIQSKISLTHTRTTATAFVLIEKN